MNILSFCAASTVPLYCVEQDGMCESDTYQRAAVFGHRSVRILGSSLFKQQLLSCFHTSCIVLRPAQLENRQCFYGSFYEIKNAKSPRASIFKLAVQKASRASIYRLSSQFGMIKSQKEEKEHTLAVVNLEWGCLKSTFQPRCEKRGWFCSLQLQACLLQHAYLMLCLRSVVENH